MEKTDQTDAFWQNVISKVTGGVDDYWVRRIGGDPETVNIILGLILKGEKTGTFGVKILQERQPEITPTLNGTAVLVDIGGTPHAAVTTTQLTPVAYKDISEEHHLGVEGPGARKLDVWQSIHWPYWTRLLEPHGLTPREDMTIMVEHFELIYPTA
jgi:uncharacterized protein YhfF